MRDIIHKLSYKKGYAHYLCSDEKLRLVKRYESFWNYENCRYRWRAVNCEKCLKRSQKTGKSEVKHE